MTITKGYRQIAEDRDSLALMKAENLWPSWPFLPVRNRSIQDRGMPKCAYLFAGAGTVLHHSNMFDASKADPKEAFESFEAMLAAGWEVD